MNGDGSKDVGGKVEREEALELDAEGNEYCEADAENMLGSCRTRKGGIPGPNWCSL